MNNKIWVGTGEGYNLYTMDHDVKNSDFVFYIKDHDISYNWPEPTRPYLTICECCGAPLHGDKCEYCGSTYIWR